MKAMFLDESGDHSLDKIDPQYPIFVLGGVIVDVAYAKGELAEELRAFKRRVLGREDIVLHTADITRNKNGFERMKERGFREEFYGELNALMRRLEYQVVACAIRKDEHLARYEISALDPYFLSLEILVERFCLELGSAGGGWIVAEKRNPTLDNQIELAWLNLKIRGTKFLRAAQVAQRIQGLGLREKSSGLAGLELADLVVTPIGRFVQGKAVREDFRIIEQKFRRAPGGAYQGYGLVVLPKK
jgi:hypothetical protein